MWYVDVFYLEIHGNEPTKVELLMSIELWKETCDVCVNNTLAESDICIYVNVFYVKMWGK